MDNQTDGVVTLAASGDKTVWVGVSKGEFNLHVMCADDDEWELYCSYDDGTTPQTILEYTGPKKFTPSEGDSLIANGVGYQVKATTINTGPFKVRIGQ